jgi:hypothetical protein
MEMIWLLIALTLFPDKEMPHDLAEDITVSYHQKPNECRNEAIKSNQRFENYLKERGMKEKYDETVRNAGIINMAICWNSKEAQLIYPKTIDSPWLAVVARFTPISGERQKVGTGIARVGRFKSLPECRNGLVNASTELARELKPQEEKAVFCVSTGRG